MKNTVVIREFPEPVLEAAYTLDLSQLRPKDCIGCWTCWWAKPGHCVHQDLNDFYRAFIHAGRVIIFAQLNDLGAAFLKPVNLTRCLQRSLRSPAKLHRRWQRSSNGFSRRKSGI